jgi:WD40 repeat protein
MYNYSINLVPRKLIYIYDLYSQFYSGHDQKTWCIATCSNSLQLAIGLCDGISCLWFLNYKQPLRFYSGHLDDVLVRQNY